MAQERNLEAFNDLVRQHMHKVYATALRITQHKQDAEDVVQQTFVSVIKNLKNFRGESAFSTWLLRIAINNTFTNFKKRKKYFVFFHQRTKVKTKAGIRYRLVMKRATLEQES